MCANRDGALDNKAFVFVEAPHSGDRVLSGFRVAGCSSTYEANVNWRLRGRDGHILAKGFTEGGSDKPGSFGFTVSYPIGARQLAHLEVYEPRVTEEGFPSVKNVLPLVLEP
ncbi:MAG: Gmad2 immunoglobulin-like domain-containing protein [Actinomycetota bacterium]